MFKILVVTATVLNNLDVSASQNITTKQVELASTIKANGPTGTVTKNNVASHHNITYIEKAENLLRTPNINKYYEENKKKKKPKKTPKRTIQKIIKKNKSKLRRVFFTRRATPTTEPPKVDYDKLYGQEDKKEAKTTTPANQRKKTKRKYSPKYSGYHMPFQKMQKKDKRHKRGLSRELFILKDLDEIEFLSKEGDQDVVKAHVKNIW